MVDGTSVGPVEGYVFGSVTQNHSIHAVFEPEYTVVFHVDMQYAESFNKDTDRLYVLGSMFDWDGKGAWIKDKEEMSTGTSLVYVAEMNLAAGRYEYLYYLNAYPTGAEWEEAPYRSFTVPDTLEIFDIFGYRTDPTKLSDITAKGQMNVYPNPARGNLTVESNLIINYLRVYDLNGRLMHAANPGDDRYDLDVYGWPDGMYFIRAETHKGAMSHRFIVNNL